MFIALYVQISKPSDITIMKTTRCFATFANRFALTKQQNTMIAVYSIELKYDENSSYYQGIQDRVKDFFVI